MAKILIFILTGLFIISLTSFGQSWTQIGDDIDGEASYDQSGCSISLSLDGSTIAIGAMGNSENAYQSGHVRVFQNVEGNWIQKGDDIDGDEELAGFGNSVSLSSDCSTVAIGVPGGTGYSLSSGYVRVYQYVNENWTQVGTDIYGGEGDVGFGTSVCLSSDASIIAIGDPHGSIGGRVYVYQNMGESWTKIGAAIHNNTDNSSCLGQSVSLSSDGSTVAVGSCYSSEMYTDAGRVQVFQNNAGNWIQVGTDMVGEASYDRSGESISLSADGSTVAIGAFFNDGNGSDSGHTRVYRNINGNWTQIGEDIDGEVAGDYSGGSVSLSSDGSTVAIGAEENDSYYGNEGHVRVYKNIDGNWVQFGADIDGEAAGDNSGYSVSLNSDGTKVAIGSIYNGGNGPYSGHVRIYRTLPVDIKDYERHNISIYPNPSTDKIYFKFENNNIRRITIFDLTGKLIIQKTFVRQNETIDLSDFDSGIYTVEIQTDEVTLTKKILKK